MKKERQKGILQLVLKRLSSIILILILLSSCRNSFKKKYWRNSKTNNVIFFNNKNVLNVFEINEKNILVEREYTDFEQDFFWYQIKDTLIFTDKGLLNPYVEKTTFVLQSNKLILNTFYPKELVRKQEFELIEDTSEVEYKRLYR